MAPNGFNESFCGAVERAEERWREKYDDDKGTDMRMTGETLWAPGGDGWCRVTITGFADDLRKKHVHSKTPTTTGAADRLMEYDKILSEEIAKEGYVQNAQKEK